MLIISFDNVHQRGMDVIKFISEVIKKIISAFIKEKPLNTVYVVEFPVISMNYSSENDPRARGPFLRLII
jgi:hypothetical protein